MDPVDLLLRLQQLDVRVRVEGGELRLSAPEETLPADLRQQITAHRTELLRFLQEASRASAALPATAITPADRDRDLPLSFAQQRFWFLLQLEQERSAYNLLYVVDLPGALDVDALRWSLGEIGRRHEILRTTIAVAEGQPHQVPGGSPAAELRQVDLSAHPDPEGESHRLAREELARPFDLAAGPLLRTTLLGLGADRHHLLICMVHLIADGWSYGVLFDELGQLYAARLADRPSPLPDLPVQYADYAAWQRDWYERESPRLLEYWRAQLDGVSTLELPTDRPRPAQQTFGGKRRVFAVPAEVLQRLKTLANREGCTHFMAMLAAFKVLLARYSGQDDIVVGTPVANRDKTETEPLIGLFLNTLVLRTDTAGNPTFRELLRRVREVCLGGFSHQDMPFEQLVVELRPERDLSRNPLFQVLFNVLYETPPPRLGDLETRLIEPETVSSMFDLSLIMGSGGGAFEYNVDLFDDATVERMEQHFLLLLDRITANPDARVWDVPLLTDAERALVLERPNRTARDYPADRCFHQLFEARARRTPDRVAAVCGDDALTFTELNARANRLAHHLRALGAGPEKLVGLSVERSLDMLVALLGILKAGAAYVPLDPSYPSERLATILEDSGAGLLVTQESLRAELPDALPQLVRLDADAEAIAAQSGDDPDSGVRPGDLAYVIFTSGSTGRPKGVSIEHRALVNFLCSMADTPGMTEDDVLLAVTTISFDIAGLELYLPLLCGGRVVIAAGGVEADGRQLAELLERSGTTLMQATPATWNLLLEAGWKGHAELVVLCGGETMPRELAERLLPRCAALWNMYGPTETTIWSLVQRVESGEGTVPIGLPIANTEVYLLDRNRQPVPIGVHGALHLGGDGLARGYWNRPELTADRFVAHPLSARDGARLYDTSDRARFRPDGSIEFLGRMDDQVKIRGFRVEPGEIDHVLSGHPAVKECAVVAKVKQSGDKQLVAHVMFHPGQSATVSELRRHLRERLPDYMVPPAFVMLDELPLTPNGKIDRKRLAQTDHAAVAGADTYVAPETPMQEFVAGVWQEVLGVDRVGALDNFFDLGGHSLLAMKVLFKVEKEVGERIMPMDLLVHNLRQFAEKCERRKSEQAAEPARAKPRGVLARLRKRLSGA